MAKRPIITNSIQNIFRNNPEMQRFLMDLSGITTAVGDISNKADKITDGVIDNIVIITTGGNIGDSGYAVGDLKLRQGPTREVAIDYQVSIEDETLWVDASSGPVVITLYPSTEIVGQTFIVEKIDDSDNYVRVAGDSETINGDAYFDLLMQYESIKPTSTGSGYLI